MKRHSPRLRRIPAVLVVAFVAGCATLPDQPAETAARRADNVKAVDLPELVVLHGFELALPAGTTVSDAYAGNPTLPFSPAGVVARFTGLDGRLIGVVQLVPLSDAVRLEGRAFLPAYLDEWGVVEDVPEFLTLPDSVFSEVAIGVSSGEPDLDLLVAVATLSPSVCETLGLLVEIWHPRDLIPEAVSILENLLPPPDASSLSRSERFRFIGDEGTALNFRDHTGRWTWVTDTHHGFVVRRRRDGHDIYVSLDLWEAVTVEAPAASEQSAGDDSGNPELAVEVTHGQWRWTVPLVPRFQRDRRRWTGRIPSVNDGQDIRIDIVEPGRAYNQGYLQVADLPDVSEIEIGVQALLDNLLTIE